MFDFLYVLPEFLAILLPVVWTLRSPLMLKNEQQPISALLFVNKFFGYYFIIFVILLLLLQGAYYRTNPDPSSAAPAIHSPVTPVFLRRS
jgi:hypothetical protein